MRSSVEVGATSWIRFSSGRVPAAVSTTMKLVAPAARASASKRSQPYASRIDAYVIVISGVSPTSARVAARHSRQAAVRMPAASAFSACGADDRPVRERIPEGEADFDDVCASLDRGRGEGRRVHSGHEVDDECA